MKTSRSFLISSLAALLGCCIHAQAAGPGDYWLVRYGLQSHMWEWDHDGDGVTAWQEYFFGTNPLNANSKPPQLSPEISAGTVSVSWPSMLGARYEIGRSLDLSAWTPSGTIIPGTGALMSANFAQSGEAEFFRLEAYEPLDSDGDGLSAIEESILGTNAALPDTDGDTLNDGVEVFTTFTNPLVANPLGGTIRGTVKSDPNGDGNATDGTAIQGTEVFLDLDYDGAYTSGEPLLPTNASGQYEFTHLAPGVYQVRQVLVAGQIQTLPAPAASPVLNRLPDEVVNYTHGINAEFPVPYGILADASAVVPYILSGTDVPLDPAITLKPINRRGYLPPFGVWSYNEFLSIPENGSILWRFDEKIIDKPGADLIIYSITNGAGEQATLQLGLTPGTLQNAGTITEVYAGSESAIPIDLATQGVTGAVQYVKITSTSSGGATPGIEIVGAEAVNFVPPMAGAIEVVVVSNETHENKNFARQFRDDPPDVFLYVDGADFRAGQSAPVTVQAQDDISISSITLTANGASIALNGDGEGTVPLPVAGTMELVATVTDSGTHTTVEGTTIYVLNADGSSPFNANLTGAGTQGAFEVEIVTPNSGAILSANTPAMARITGIVTPNWVLDYAPVNLIDPYNMTAPDPDWITLGSGTGFLSNQSAGTLPVSTLPNGIYFLRLSATPTSGGATVYRGQVFAKGVAPEDIQPHVTITSPAQGSTADLVAAISGSITSTRPLVEWFAEYAPASSVDTNDLGSSTPPWKRFAQGTTTIANNVIASLDTSLIADGSYIVRIVAWNDIRLGWVEPLPIEISNGGFKPGRLRVEFTDLTIPVGGIPFVIKRVYDSLDADKDTGLGHGWSHQFLNPGINETVPQTGSGMFGSTPFKEGTRVYINTPEGRRIGFTFHAEFGVGGIFGAVYKAQFIPDPGVYEALEVPEGDQPFLSIDGNGNAFISFLGSAWNPSTYILTTRDGIRYTYDEDTGFREAGDTSGNTLTATPSGLRHSTGAQITFVRNGQNHITQIIAPDGITVDYGYDAAGDLTTVTDDDSRVTTLTYFSNPAHHLKDVTDPFGRTGTRYEYDAGGRLVATIDEDGERIEQTWNPGSFTGSITDRRGNVTNLVYDPRGNVTQSTNALGGVTTYVYGDPANPDKETSVTDARSNTTSYEHDALGNITRVLRPIFNFEEYVATWSPAGDLLTERAFDGQLSTFTHDALRRLTRRQIPGESPVDYAYSPEGLVFEESVTEPGNPLPVARRTREHDAQGRLARLSGNPGISVQTSFAANGKLLNMTLPGGHTYSFAHDAQGVPTSMTDPLSNQTTLVQEPDGNFRITDRLGRITRYLLAADGKVERITRPGSSVTHLAYNEERNPSSFTDAAGNVTQFQYDALNRMTSFTDAANASATVAYDAVGNVTEIINRNGKRRTFVYDANNRLTNERWHNTGGAVVREFIYTWSSGKLISVTDGAASWNFLGPLPRPSNVTVSYPGQTTRTISYAWERGGLAGPGGNGGHSATSEAKIGESTAPTNITLTGGTDFIRIEATYDDLGLRRLVWSPPNDFFGGPDIHFESNASGRVGEIRRYRGALVSKTTFAYDALNHVTSMSHRNASGALLHSDAQSTLVRDAECRVTSIVRASDTTTSSYDVLDQLTGVAHTSGAPESYSYDGMGVRTASHLVPGPATIGTANRLTAAGPLTFVHDAEGNLTEKTDTNSGHVTRYSYDHRDQLVLATIHANAAAPATTTVAFEYDYMGRMMSRSLNGAKTWIIYDRQMPFAEFADGASVVNAAFLYSPDRYDDFHSVWRSGTGTRDLLKDHLGTVLGATDNTGALAWWTSYDAFGNLRGVPPAGGESLRFTGRFYNEALGLYEMRARFYDPLLGRFTQEDPIRFAARDMNLYRYAGNNPLNGTDPTGTLTAVENITIAGIVVGAGASLGGAVIGGAATIGAAIISVFSNEIHDALIAPAPPKMAPASGPPPFGPPPPPVPVP